MTANFNGVTMTERVIRPVCETEGFEMGKPSVSNSVAGTKQVLRAVRENRISKVILACDVDDYIRRKITESCVGVLLEDGPTMVELGKSCNLSVGTAVIGILKD